MCKLLYVCFVGGILVVSGCSKQPTEMQKAAIEKEMTTCLVRVNEDPIGDSADEFFGEMVEMLTGMAGMAKKLILISNKNWELIEEEGRPTLVNLEFKSEGTKFSCDYIYESESGFDLKEVRRNNEVVYNREINQKILKEKRARLAKEEEIERERLAKEEEAERIAEEERRERLAKEKEEKRIADIKLWHEKEYSNATYKYYQKRHVKSKGNYNDPSLKIDCNPEGVTVKLDDRNIRLSSRKGVRFKFLISDQSTIESFDLTSGGTVGRWQKGIFLGDVFTDLRETHRFLDLLETANSVTAAGVTFNVDDYTQVPCLKNRKEVLAASKQRLNAYKEKIESYINQDDSPEPSDKKSQMNDDQIARETSYILLGDTHYRSDSIFDSGGSQIIGGVTIEHDSLALSKSSIAREFGTLQLVKRDNQLEEISILVADSKGTLELTMDCKFNYSDAISDKYNGYAFEYCDIKDLNDEMLNRIADADAIRFTAKGTSFESTKLTKEQKIFINDFKEISAILSMSR